MPTPGVTILCLFVTHECFLYYHATSMCHAFEKTFKMISHCLLGFFGPWIFFLRILLEILAVIKIEGFISFFAQWLTSSRAISYQQLLGRGHAWWSRFQVSIWKIEVVTELCGMLLPFISKLGDQLCTMDKRMKGNTDIC